MQATATRPAPTNPQPFSTLAGAQFLALTTYRRNGAPVVTPVWFAPCGGALAVRTEADSGKVKRLRHSSVVSIAPCTFKGKATGPSMAATARVLELGGWPAGDAALARKYGLLRRAINLMNRFRRRAQVLIAIEPPATA